MVKIEALTAERFAAFGTLLEFSPHPEDSRFEVKVQRPGGPGWRLAVFRVTIREAARMECHRTTPESFIPSGGQGVLLCAAPSSPEQVHAFVLDKPICLNPGVWHEVVALSGEAFYQITEDLDVESEFHVFPRPVSITVQENELP